MLVSIILPIFNVEEFLVECLESVMTEIQEGYEVILVNDGSTDGSIDIIATYKKKYPSIIVINKINGGLSSARNSGLEIAAGKYLLFIDADDVLEPGILKKLIYDAECNHSDIAIADYYEFENREHKKYRYDKALVRDPLISEKDRLEKLFTIDVSFAVWNKLYRSGFLKENNLFFLPGYWFEDLDFVFRAFFFAEKIIKTEGLLVGYRQRKGSIMQTVSLKIMDKMEIMDRIAIFLKNEGKFERYEEMYKILYLKMMFSIIYACIKTKKSPIESKEIITKLFQMAYFSKIKTTPLLMGAKMKLAERVMFFLIKTKLVNPSSLRLLSQLLML